MIHWTLDGQVTPYIEEYIAAQECASLQICLVNKELFIEETYSKVGLTIGLVRDMPS